MGSDATSFLRARRSLSFRSPEPPVIGTTTLLVIAHAKVLIPANTVKTSRRHGLGASSYQPHLPRLGSCRGFLPTHRPQNCLILSPISSGTKQMTSRLSVLSMNRIG